MNLFIQFKQLLGKSVDSHFGIRIASMNYKDKDRKQDTMHIESFWKTVEQKSELSSEDLEKFVLSFIPESCDDCVWLKEDEKSYCPSSEGAPCKISLNRVLDYLGRKGLI
jgi:hypothetical protein